MNIFEYAIVFKPKDSAKKVSDTAKVIVGIKTVLAKDAQTATLLAARDIPESYVSRLDEIEVAVRPF